jgi:hypothetical protein
MEKRNIKENKFYCLRCYWSFSLSEVEVKELRKEVKRAGSSKERVRRFWEKRGEK